MQQEPAVIREDVGPVVRLRLNRPQRGNALGAELLDAMHAALETLERDPPAALVLEAAGRHFCTGFDLADLEQETDATLLARVVSIELMLQRVARLPCITVALVQGSAFGAGADLVVACDRRVILGDAAFAFPGTGFGLVLGTRRLAALLGADRALDIVRSGRRLGAEEALAINLANARFATAEEAMAALPGWGVGRLEAATLAGLRAATRDGAMDDASLADLVRSAARPGLKARLQRYVAQVAAARKR